MNASSEERPDQTSNGPVPRHIAIIMDGNGRWAKAKNRPRFLGHRAGVETVRKVVRFCLEDGVENLTLFAFSSENWRRPAQEINLLMELFASSLDREVKELDENNVRLSFVGDRSAFNSGLQEKIARAERVTADNSALTVNFAVNYGGRWDIAQAVRSVCAEVLAGELTPADIDEERLAAHLSLAGLPEPELFIRTGGEQRISNFLLWQLAYTELYFTDVLWPDFDRQVFSGAIEWYKNRQRRFGRTGEQVERLNSA